MTDARSVKDSGGRRFKDENEGTRISVHRVAQNLVNIKYSVVLMIMFRFGLARQFLERSHRVLSCALNISKNFRKFNKK